jgi:hypothetical protein
MNPTIRRYDIDWLRVITIGLLLIYHIAIVFQPWAALIGFVQSNESLNAVWIAMSMINIWRIPLLFFVSGTGVAFAIKKRNWKQLILERTQRILVPFLFGMIFIVPIHVLIWQHYYHQEIVFAPQQGHLWFLKNIYVYVLVLAPLFFYLRKHENGQFNSWLRKLYSHPFGLLVIVGAFVVEAIIVNPEAYELYAFTWHGFFLGFLAFLFGFSAVINSISFWPTILKWRWIFLSLALLLFLSRFVQFDLKAPNYLMGIESCMWIFAVFGFGYKYLNRPSSTLSYLSQGAYPIYIIHMIFLYLGSIIVLPLEIPTYVKFILVIVLTFTGCFALYEVIRRVAFLRPLFGLKNEISNDLDSLVIKNQSKKQDKYLVK